MTDKIDISKNEEYSAAMRKGFDPELDALLESLIVGAIVKFDPVGVVIPNLFGGIQTAVERIESKTLRLAILNYGIQLLQEQVAEQERDRGMDLTDAPRSSI